MSTKSPNTKEMLDQIVGKLRTDNEVSSPRMSDSPKKDIPWKPPFMLRLADGKVVPMTTEQMIRILLILAGVGFSAYNVYQSFQIEKERDRQNLRWISILILVIFVILLVMIPFQ